MQIHIGYEIKLTFIQPTPMIALLHIYPNRYKVVQEDTIHIDPYTPHELYIDNFGNCCMRLMAPSGSLVLKHDSIVEVTDEYDWCDLEAKELPMLELPHETLEFLYPSRYCEVDRMQDFAWKKFGHIQFGYQRVEAICDWVHHHIEFGYDHARVTKTAYDVLNERKGVCRDFAHLAIALCRSLCIPARYVTGYLGDIGVPIQPNPMDFSAWIEVFLSNRWYTFDPRHNARRIGRIVVAYGRDAADVAIITTFGAHHLEHFAVYTDELSKDTCV